MALEIRVSRRQKIISRVIIAFLTLGVFTTLLQLSLSHAKVVKDGDITTYTNSDSLYFSIQSAFLGLAAGLLGIFYGKQRHVFFRFVGAALIFIGLFILFNSPTGLNHKLVVTPDYFYQRIGSWYSPVETRVEFKDVKYMSIGEIDEGRGGPRRYELGCETSTNADALKIEINDLMKAALPEIYKRAADRKVFIGDSPDGRPIPSDL